MSKITKTILALAMLYAGAKTGTCNIAPRPYDRMIRKAENYYTQTAEYIVKTTYKTIRESYEQEGLKQKQAR